jgi:hypothetical protein
VTSKDVRNVAKTQVCPESNGKNGPREILYGLPHGPPGPKVYQLGRSSMRDGDPELARRNCDWQGSAGEKRRTSDE